MDAGRRISSSSSFNSSHEIGSSTTKGFTEGAEQLISKLQEAAEVREADVCMTHFDHGQDGKPKLASMVSRLKHDDARAH
eukprot:1109630-Pelagomonas_calceolata.AAC.1